MSNDKDSNIGQGFVLGGVGGGILKPTTVIGEGVIVAGELHLVGDTVIDGEVHGNIASSGRLVLGPKSRVMGNINGVEVQIAGVLQGDVAVTGGIALTGRAVVRGNLSTPVFSVAEGVKFEGRIDMPKSKVETQAVA